MYSWGQWELISQGLALASKLNFKTVPVLYYLNPSYISSSFFTFPGATTRIFLVSSLASSSFLSDCHRTRKILVPKYYVISYEKFSNFYFRNDYAENLPTQTISSSASTTHTTGISSQDYSHPRNSNQWQFSPVTFPPKTNSSRTTSTRSCPSKSCSAES